jgi:branched-subunit amino acid transport protein AzlD
MNPEIILIVLIIIVGGAVLFVLPYWSIFRKAGFDPYLSVLMLIPLVNIAMLFYLAFSEWPILKQQQKQAGTEESRGS